MRAVALHAALAAVALLAAYATWTREEEVEAPAGEVTMFECALPELSRVSVQTPSYVNTIEPREGAGGRTYWVTSQRRPKPKPKPEPGPDAGVAASDAGRDDREAAVAQTATQTVTQAGEAADTAADEPPPEVFRANTKLDAYLKDLAPVRAGRALGVVEDARQGAFGFDDVDTFVTVECGGKRLELEVGGRTFGSGNRYVRRKQTGEVFLVPGSLIQDLQSARFKFKQTDLHRFEVDAVDGAEVRVQGRTRSLIHRRGDGADLARWVDAAEPDKRNELFGNWFSRVAKLRARDYLAAGAEPGSDLDPAAGAPEPPEPIVDIAYVVEGKPEGEMRLVRVRQGETSHYYARTETTLGWVSLHGSAARLVADDAPLLVGLEQAPSAEPPPPPAPSAPMPGMPTGHPALPPP